MDLLTQYLNTQQVSFETNLPMINNSSEVEAVHDIRVSIKKTRSLFLLLEFILAEAFDLKQSYKQFKPIFKKIGFLRDLQVQKMLCLSYEEELKTSLDAYSDFIKGLDSKQRKKIEKWLPSFTKPDWDHYYILINNLVDTLGMDLIIEKSNIFIEHKLDKIRELLPTDDIQTLHRIRRLLKEIRYIIDCMCSPINEDEMETPVQASIKIIEDDFGNWHDRVISAELLDRLYAKDIQNNLKLDPTYIRLNKIVERESFTFLDQGKLKLEKVLRHEQFSI